MLVTNIAAMSRWQKTHDRLQEVAMQLFMTQGYAATGTAQIAQRAGVSEMTLFRHFPSKEALLLEDPFDAVIADEVRQRPAHESPMRALTEAVRTTWHSIDADSVNALRASLLLIAQTPNLQGAIERNTNETRAALTEALIERGVPAEVAGVATAAVIAGLSAALLTWANSEQADLGQVIDDALDLLGGS